jgi:hypothetical protein
VASADVTTPATATDYPPAPWRLHGQAHFHVLAVRAERLPPTPDDFRPLVLGGRGLVVVGARKLISIGMRDFDFTFGI